MSAFARKHGSSATAVAQLRPWDRRLPSRRHNCVPEAQLRHGAVAPWSCQGAIAPPWTVRAFSKAQLCLERHRRAFSKAQLRLRISKRSPPGRNCALEDAAPPA
jgi:hypothetical protein